MIFRPLLVAALLVSLPAAVFAQEANYDEAKVPEYKLPDPLACRDGTQVTDAATWTGKRRPEVLKLFENQVYGSSPEPLPEMKFKLIESSDKALDGKAVRKQVRVLFNGKDDGPKMDILIYLPAQAKRPVPAFVGLNFAGNHAIHDDPQILLSDGWMRPKKNAGIVDNRATEEARGKSSSRWPVEMILARGYALATIYCGDIDPDKNDFSDGVHPLFYKQGQKQPGPAEWGTIGAWAWGLSRAMDYFETDKDIDEKHVAVLGHSRLGKTSLWAGASDPRFAIVISNNSGCGGAALSRRAFGETVKRINTSFPHWFCDNFLQYNGNEVACPVDQHMLIALMAPRPVYIASAAGDRWADPRGEFLSGKHAGPVYALFGKTGVGVGEHPGVDKPVGDTIGYHIRTGGHDVKDYDWEQYLKFADRHFGRKQ